MTRRSLPLLKPNSLRVHKNLKEMSMLQLANVLTAIAALIHFGLMIAEMFFWKQPIVHERLDYKEPDVTRVAPIVANAGLYNGFIASGLVWGLISSVQHSSISVFFLVCVIIAGLYGAVTLRPTTLIIQTLPAIAALICVWLSSPIL
jgi:putative membrane protein